MPGTVAYDVDTATGSGEEAVTVPVDPAAARTITLETGSGDLRLRPTA